ncbi:hypothetical protein [Streptomyces sp. AcH 505]|uniref:hypothetical protein n=1 Tax=Streptomyces sp. AcH 505 TaxID=352211 RepID=UPI000A465D17
MSDDFYDHPKFERVGALGVALWAEGLAWSNRNLTDGRIPRNVARRLIDFEEVIETVLGSFGDAASNAVTHDVTNSGADPENYAVAASTLRQNTIVGLITAELWVATPGGYLIHHYLEYQKSADQIHAERDKNAARQRAFKDRKKQAASPGNGSSNGPSNGVTDPPSNPPGNAVTDDDTHSPVTDAPNPNPNTSFSKEKEGDSPGSEIPDEPSDRDDVEEVCLALADAIQANGSKRPKITTTWRREARLLIDKDRRTQEQVLAAIAWSQADTFWRGNVLSMPKLREKYDQLRLAALREQEQRAASTTPGQPSEDLFDRALARAQEKEQEQ